MVYVGVPWTEMNGGHKSLACGLSTYASIDQHHGPEVQEQSPIMHPAASEMHRRLWEIGRHIGERVPVFQVEAVVNNRVWAGPLQLLDLRRRRLPAGLGAARRLPPRARRWMRKGLRSFYQPAGVWAGAVEPVHEAALARLAGFAGEGGGPGRYPGLGVAQPQPVRGALRHEPAFGGESRPGLRVPVRPARAPGATRGLGRAGEPLFAWASTGVTTRPTSGSGRRCSR